MRHMKNPDTKEKGRFIQTSGDAQFIAKDRSNKLNKIEAPDLGAIISKMKGEDAQENLLALKKERRKIDRQIKNAEKVLEKSRAESKIIVNKIDF